MITIQAEQENYCLLTDGNTWTVAERRAGKYHPIGDCSRPGVMLDSPEAASLFGHGRSMPERRARQLMTNVAADWRSLFEVIR